MIEPPEPLDAGIPARLKSLKEAMLRLEAEYTRQPGSTQLLAVSKRHPAMSVRRAYRAGQRMFGENFLQEAMTKQGELADCEIEWHFIGAIQSNKTKDIARNFSWVHTVASHKVAERLSRARPSDLPALNVLVQINVSGESSKHGVEPTAAAELVNLISNLPGLRYRGLMALPALADDQSQQRRAFHTVNELAHAIGTEFDTLSMGTTHDFEAAIAEGSTMIRLGTAIFGPRPT